MLGRKIQTLLDVSQETKRPLLVGTVILVFLSIFTKSQASSPFEAMNSAHLSMCQKDVKPLVVYDVEYEMAMDSMKRKCASS